MWRRRLTCGVLLLFLAGVSACGQLAPTPTAPSTVRPTSTPTLPGPTAVVGQPSADWPMFRFSLDRAGYNPHELTVRPPLKLEWEFQAQSKI